MSELKKCPFCGGEVEIALTGNKGEQWFVTRGLGKNKCTCRVFMESNMFSADDSDTKAKERDKLIAKWNTRTPMANILEKLEEEKGKVVIDGKVLYQEDYFIDIDKAINIVKQEINKEN
jgi:hypothetical protein